MRSVEEELREKLQLEEKAVVAVTLATSADIVQQLEHFIKRFVELPTGMSLAVALWVIGTYLFNRFEVFPYLAITAPAKRCGKTRVTEVLELVCANARRTSNVSEAALFRLIDKYQPTLFIDEAEALSDKRNERSQFLIGILNSGHRVGAHVLRCVGVGTALDVKPFSTYCPKCIVAIGSLRDTLSDRSLMLQMQRKGRDVKVDRFLLKQIKAEAAALKQAVEQLATRHEERIETEFQNIDFPSLVDREAENWSSLFAICAVIAPQRLLELQVTAVGNSAAKEFDDEDESLSILLLANVRDILRETGVIDDELQVNPIYADDVNKGIASIDLLAKLRMIDESPWGENDFDLTARKLARNLRPFRVHVQKVETESAKRLNGYRYYDLSAAMRLYAPSIATSRQGQSNE